MTESSSGADLFNDLAHEFAERHRRGERPTAEEYARRHPDLADEIRDLFPALGVMEDLGSAFPGSGSVAPEAGPGPGAPARLGEYRILREIARGGMGVVYEAVQESLGRRVALKVLPGQPLLSPHALERFRREARAAANLHHTNIVPVFGVGEADGVHFYAMQFIQGQSLASVMAEVKRLRPRAGAVPPTVTATGGLATQVADRLLSGRFERPTVTAAGPAPPAAPPPTAPGPHPTSGILSQPETGYYRSVARVGLQVAEALAYAHQQGILHRDIKPANLLLDTHGVVWVTDFGLAKAEGADELTTPGDILGTLRYMAPERFQGKADARSDVYALGLTLYELATLEPAFAASDRAALIDLVRQQDPARPRAVDPNLPRDLETIILKAIAKDPRDRYPTAAALAEDLRRFLADRTILARRATAAERAWRWARRNPAVAALTTAVLVLLATGLPVVTGLWLRAARHARAAEQRQQEAEVSLALARGAVDEYLTTVSEDTVLKSPAPGLQPLRRKLLEAALRYYQEFVRRHGDDPSLRADLAAAHGRVGEIVAEVGSKDEAGAALEAAAGLYAELAAGDPADWRFPAGRGRALTRTARLEADRGRDDRALPLYAEGIGLLEAVARDHPAEDRPREDLAFAHHSLALRLNSVGRGPEAEAHIGRAIDLRRALADAHPADPRYRFLLASGLANLSYTQFQGGKPAAALDHLRQANALQRDLVRGDPDNAEYRHFLSLSARGLGMMHKNQGRWGEAEPLYQESVDLMEQVVAENPRVTEYRRVLATSYAEFGQELIDRDRLPDGLEAYAKARARAEEVRQREPDDLNNLISLADVHRGTGKALGKQGKPADGLAAVTLAVAIETRIAPRLSLAAYNLACSLAQCSALAGRLAPGPGGGPAAARRYADQAMDALRRAVGAGWKDVTGMEQDPDLIALRDRADYRDLMASLRTAPPGK
jgi:serine/threonine protein kinase